MAASPRILFGANPPGGRRLLRRLRGRALFLAVLGNTETAKVPGLSAAGANPRITDYTPPADAEYLLLGRCLCIPVVPVTPEGIPTPALLAREALRRARIPTLPVAAGLRVKPQVPYLDLLGTPGNDIQRTRALPDARGLYERARQAGETLASTTDVLLVGESIAGGTTTALALLLGLGYDAENRVSSSLPHNPRELKLRVVRRALRRARIRPGRTPPLEVASQVGDPMMVAAAGLAAGAAPHVPVLLCGGTQMAAVAALLHGTAPRALRGIAVGTTRWLLRDPSSDLPGLLRQIGPIPLLGANVSFARLQEKGLRAYEEGVVKEGVGCGGASVAALARRPALTPEALARDVQRSYRSLLKTSRAP